MNNIVDAYPREGAVFSTKPLFQWDWGQIVRLHIRDLPATYKVEFSNSTRADAVSTVQTTEEVIVPAQFLESGNPVYAWVVVVDEARTTEYSLIIPVSVRAKPTDLEPAPEERTEIEQTLSALNQAVEQTAADVEAAKGYAEEAEQSAESAVIASENAIDAKEVAIAAKNTAETKASEAAASASNALTAAQNASASASQANTSAQNAASSASEAETAKENAESAKNAAQSAAQSVAHAMDTLEATIQADLQAAKESGEFDGANGKDGQDGFSPTAAVNKAGDISTIIITDKNGTTTAIVKDGKDGADGYTPQKGIDYFDGEPGKDGKDGQPGSAGKDGKDGADGSPGAPGVDGTTFTPSVSTEGVISWTNDGGKTNPQPVNIKGPQGDPGDDYILTAADKAEIAQQAEELLAPVLDTKSPAIWEDASGSIAHFEDGAEDMPLRECVVQIEPVQEGTGDPSPDNVRPITGWTGLNLFYAGKNLLNDANILDKAQIARGDSGYEIKSANIYKVFSVDVPKNTDLHLSKLKVSGSSLGLGTEYAQYGTQVEYVGSMTNYYNRTFNTGNNPYLYLMTGSNIELNDTDVSWMLSIGQDTTEFELSKGTTIIPIDWADEAGTVYGGTLDVVRGVLTVTHGMIASYAGETLPGEWISDRDVYADGTTPTTGAQVVYALAEPIVYDLTQQEIKTLLGTNNIWADTGDTAVTYPADTKMFVEQNTPEIPVQDVQVNGTSVVTDGVANVPIGSSSTFGVLKSGVAYGTTVDDLGRMRIAKAASNEIKSNSGDYKPITPSTQHESTFYGLAKASGDTTQRVSSNAVGNYTESAKSAISTMLNGPVTVSGATPSITALPGIQYICGEVSTLDITLPASGCVDVVFQSGSTATVLTVTPPTGVTVKWANGFDPTALEANTTYEINIKDGLGVAGSWT